MTTSMKLMAVIRAGRKVGILEKTRTGYLYSPEWDGRMGIVSLVWKQTWEEILEVVGDCQLVPWKENSNETL